MPLRIQYNHWRNIALLLITTALAGCGTVSLSPTGETSQSRPTAGTKSASNSIPALPRAGSGRGGYYLDDGPGDNIPDGLQDLPDAEPKVEPYTKSGNRPYVVFGKQYTPFTDDRPLKQRGVGSWYGKKFHGQKTSSGELYDMYKMTAAHPTLPLPSYARVTNVANGKQVIVRVNDRGPFHSSRIVDLSYAAAFKLGYLGKGSAQLEVERLLPDEIERIASSKREQGDPSQQTAAQPAIVVPSAAVIPIASQPSEGAVVVRELTPAVFAPGFYIQLGAYSQAGNADAVRDRLMKNWASTLPPIEIIENGPLYRLHSGPFTSRADAASAALRLQNAGITTTTIVQR